MTLLQVAIGTYCFMVPWAQGLRGLDGDFECHPERSGTAQMIVGKVSETKANVSLSSAQWETKILPGKKSERLELWSVNPAGIYKAIIECDDPTWRWGGDKCTIRMVPWEEGK